MFIKKVVILQRLLPHYRISVFDNLVDILLNRDITMEVIYGQEFPGTSPKTVEIDRPWATFSKNTFFKIGNKVLVYQHISSEKLNADLVIFEQANRLLRNYPLLLLKKRGRMTAFWGHGRNMQKRGGLFERWKKILINNVDWWFAYTDISRDIVVQAGFPAERVSVVQNAIDTTALSQSLSKISPSETSDLIRKNRITGKNIGLYCGRFYTDKKIDFLLSSSLKIKKKLADFELIVIGSGPEEDKIIEAAYNYPWIHYLGAKYGKELAPYLKCAKTILMPGGVGLVLLDSFVAETPIITTDHNRHGPEIAYLTNNKNGILTNYKIDTYAETVVHFLTSSSLQRQLKSGCRDSAQKYTLDSMVMNIANGISSCLAANKS